MPALRFTETPCDAPEWERIVAPFRDLGLTQCWAYGAARAEEAGWSVERGTIAEADGPALGAAQVMIRRLPAFGGGLAWIGRGPLWQSDDADPARLGPILVALRRHYVDRRGFYLRIAPTVSADSADDAVFAAAGFRATGMTGWASATVDLADAPDVLRARLAQKWRNALNKAERLEVRVVRGGDDAFERFLAEYRGFVAGRGFATSVTPELLSALQRHLPPDRRFVCYRADNGLAPLGSVLIVRYGSTAEYLAGTLLDAGRGYNVGQLLLWRALCDARADGLARFDVGGMDPRLTPKGIFDFKQGLGGAPYRHVNEIEADNGGPVARLVRWRVGRSRAASAERVHDGA